MATKYFAGLGKKHLFAWCVLILWLVGVSLFLWTRFYQDYRFFSLSHQPRFNVQANIEASGNQITLVHFVDESCPCSRFSLPHIELLEEQYAMVEHLRINADNLPADDRFDWAVASPAVAVFDGRGELAYYGPYTSDVICGLGEDLLAGVVAALANNESMQWLNLSAYGCFCDWPSQHLTRI